MWIFLLSDRGMLKLYIMQISTFTVSFFFSPALVKTKLRNSVQRIQQHSLRSNACGCQAALLYHIEFGNHYTCKFLFCYAQGPRASLDWIYKSVCYKTGMLPFDLLRGPVCNAAASSVL